MDAQACLDILSRAAKEHAQAQGGDLCCRNPNCGQDSKQDAGGGYAGDVPPPPPPPMAGLAQGQVLDLETGANETLGPDMTEEGILQKFKHLRPKEEEAAAGGAETSTSGRTASQPSKETAKPEAFTGEEAARLVLDAISLHEERVAVYKDFDAAFRHLMEGEGGGTRPLSWTYPFVVKCATQRFQAISQGIRAIASALEDRSMASRKPLSTQADEASSSLRSLQRTEAERLQLVAAHHAEQARLLLTKGPGSRVKKGELEAIMASVEQYRKQLGSTAQEIDELVSELRYTAAEMRE
eukprot:TRINITY_DN90123_c0_g1_i1.p1 TRINITY_DN90123_c0_g1~~TRINITY_DN90123_c0_g1_i1.p1  ORF type:complete len:305 (+),score=81.38 TRINITY_DN90123_c0_g1_i1:26-916(+)